MDPVPPLEQLHGASDHDGAETTSWVSVCPRGLWKVQWKQIQRGSQQTSPPSGGCSRPTLGSLCRVRVQLKADVEEAGGVGSEELLDQTVPDAAEASFPRCLDSVLQVPLGDWTTLRLGEGQCDVTEACVEGMRAGETCEILVSPVKNGLDTVKTPAAQEDLPLCVMVELRAFTPGRESWEMSPGEKWAWVKSHKERGGMRFRDGDVWGAADSYSRALKLLITLQGLVREAEKTEERETEEQIDTNSQNRLITNEARAIKAELHCNLSLCQLKLNQPERAKASATKATQLDPGGAKAWYRLGRACQMVNELEEARQAFQTLLKLQPDSPAALKALKDIASREKKTNAQLGQRLSKMFS
ncbi:FK506-binding protein-like [Aulostomus maculatus]